MRQTRVASIPPPGEPRISVFGGERDRALGRSTSEGDPDLACRLLTRAGETGCNITAYPEDNGTYGLARAALANVRAANVAWADTSRIRRRHSRCSRRCGLPKDTRQDPASSVDLA